MWHYHVTKRKHQMRLQVWQTECAECGELFTIKVSPYRELPGEFGLTRCKAHRGTLEEINKRKQFERDLRSREALELLGAGHSVAAVHLATGVPVPTLYRWRKGDDHGN